MELTSLVSRLYIHLKTLTIFQFSELRPNHGKIIIIAALFHGAFSDKNKFYFWFLCWDYYYYILCIHICNFVHEIIAWQRRLKTTIETRERREKI